MSTGFGFSVGCTPTFSVTHSADEAAVCGLWRCTSAVLFAFFDFGLPLLDFDCLLISVLSGE